MSIIADPPMLVTTGEGYARALPEGAQAGAAKAVGALVLGVFWTAAAGFWFDHPLTVPFRKQLGYRSGREFMLRFPLPDRGRRRRDPREDALALAAFAAYPLWYWLGWDHGRRRRPRGA